MVPLKYSKAIKSKFKVFTLEIWTGRCPSREATLQNKDPGPEHRDHNGFFVPLSALKHLAENVYFFRLKINKYVYKKRTGRL